MAKTAWVNTSVKVCAIFLRSFQGLLGLVDPNPGLTALGYFPLAPAGL